MPTLTVGGRKVTVGDDFLNLSPEQQNATVEEIAGSLGGGQQPYSLGPISDIAELGARGINAAVTALGGQPREPQPMFQPVNLPWIGQPSMGKFATSMYDTAKSGATLPGDVYAGKVDPLSEEGLRRAYDLAAIAPTGTIPTVARRVPSPSLPATEVKGAAAASYDAIRQRTRGDLVEPQYAQTVADHMAAVVEDAGGARRVLAKDTHDLIDRAAKAKDMADLVDVREGLGKIVRKGGKDGNAAAIARSALEEALGPEISGIARTADRNYAIGSRAGELEQKVANNIKRAENRGTGGNVGNSIRQAVEPLTMEGAKNVSPEVLAAAERVTRPGLGVKALQVLSSFDPTSSKLMAALTMKGINPATWPFAVAGAGSRMLYDRVMRNRAAAVSDAMRREAPANLISPGYQPGGLLQMPGAQGANYGILGPMQSEYPLRITVRPSDSM